MENKATPSLEQLTQDAVNNNSDFIKIDNDIYAVLSPNKIFYTHKRNLDKFKYYSLNDEREENNLSVTFVPTLDCNLNCIYCYSKGGDYKEYMNPLMATNFLSKLFDSNKYSSLNIRFAGGGEPFLNFDCIKEVTKSAKELTDHFSLHCITNGTFGDEVLNWILEERPQMRISYDSISQYIQRPFRNFKNSSRIIRENIKELLKNDIETIIQSTITSINVSKMNEIALDNYELGLRTIKVEPVYITENSRGSSYLNISPKEFVSNFINMVKYIKENNFDIQIDTAFFSRPTLGYYCSMPTGNMILTPSGKITSCVEITNNCDYNSHKVFYGKFDETLNEIIFDDSKKESFKKFHFSNYDECSSCNLKLICRGGCPLRRIWNQQDHSCKISKELVPQILKLFYEDKSYINLFVKNK